MDSNGESDSVSGSLSDSQLSPLFCDSGELFTWEEIQKVLSSKENHI